LPTGLNENVKQEAESKTVDPAAWNLISFCQEISLGTRYLFAAAPLHYALGMQLVAAIIGAEILVNTVSQVTGKLHGSSLQYGWVMAAYGLGAALAAVVLGWWQSRHVAAPEASESEPGPTNLLPWVGLGAALMTSSLLVADPVGWQVLLGLWLVAGMGEGWINVPTQTLLADCIPADFQGRVYGAHYAWSHLWWVGAYPLAGWLGSLSHTAAKPVPIFLWGGLIGLGVGVVVQSVWWVNSRVRHEAKPSTSEPI
jgi:MFS transporter, NRE family, putaive nickel resistance protein